eukprot:UN10068
MNHCEFLDANLTKNAVIQIRKREQMIHCTHTKKRKITYGIFIYLPYIYFIVYTYYVIIH